MHYLSGMAGCLGRGINNKHRRQASIRSLRFDGKQKGVVDQQPLRPQEVAPLRAYSKN